MHTEKRMAVLGAAAAMIGWAVVAAPGCEEKKAAPQSTGGAAAGTQNKAHDHDHDHGMKPDDHSGDESVSLGTVKIGGWDVAVSQEGGIEAGKEGHFDVVLSGSAAKPSAVRVWIGTEDARGSIKSLAHAHGMEYHAHAEVPSPLGPEAMLWIEIEEAGGAMSVGWIELKR